MSPYKLYNNSILSNDYAFLRDELLFFQSKQESQQQGRPCIVTIRLVNIFALSVARPLMFVIIVSLVRDSCNLTLLYTYYQVLDMYCS